MTMNWRKRTHEEWTKDIVRNGYDVVGVLKFDNGRHMQAKQALTLYKAYWHKVDRTVFGLAADKGYGVKRLCFSEFGSDGKNLHLHFVAISPFAEKPFCATLNALWSDFNRRTADHKHNWITPIQQIEKAAAYTSKSTKNFGMDDIGLATSFQPKLNLRHDTFETEAQIQRIKNRLTDEQLEQAYKELKRHIVETTIHINKSN